MRDHMQMRFIMSYKYLKDVKNEIKSKARKSQLQTKLEHLREEAEKTLGIKFDFDEVIEND